METIENIVAVKISEETKNISVYSAMYKKILEKYINAADNIESLYNKGLITFIEAVKLALEIYVKGV